MTYSDVSLMIDGAWTKGAGSRTIVEHGATISHQHGVGLDHAPYLEAEKGPLGMAAVEAIVAAFDPDGRMARGALLGEASH